jgi:hypothetical protein
MNSFSRRNFAAFLLCSTLLVGTAAAERFSVEPVKWRELDAYKITDGRTEAVVVPQLGGRLMHYGLVNGDNWIWNGQPGAEKIQPALLWGGDKTYIGPHTMWRFTQPVSWPPPSPDGAPHTVELGLGNSPGALRTTSPDWPGYGARVTRDYRFEKGELIITHRITKVEGSAALVAAWTITQTTPEATVYVPLAPKSPYRDGVFWWDYSVAPEKLGATFLSPKLLRIVPVTGAGFKLGAHPAKPALAAVQKGLVFLQQSDRQEGEYPEGVEGAGFTVEVYHHNQPPPNQYTELELLSPLRRLDQGAELVTRWSIHPVADGKEEQAAVEELFAKENGPG